MEIARGTDLPDLLASLGYTVTRIGRYYSTKEMDSLRIKNRRTWYRYSERMGGDAITFLQHFLSAVRARAEETLASLMKQRTILNVRKKKRRALYDALSDAEALAPARDCYESGMPGMEEPFARYMDAVSALEQCGIHREQLMAEKAELYRQLADVNREIRRARKEISMCDTIERNRPQMEHDIHVAEAKAKEVERDEYRRR